MLLKDKIVLVSGASRGIGRAVALEAAKEGASLVITGSNAEALAVSEALVKEQGAAVLPFRGDLRDAAVIGGLIQAVRERFGRLDVLVNNAGVNSRTKTMELTFEEWRDILDVNLNAVFRLSRAALPMLLESGGSMVNISSAAAKAPHPNASVAYSASKGAVVAMTRHWALEFAPLGVRVNAICPGAVATEMVATWTEEYRERKLAAVPLKRLGLPWEVAALAVYLASEKAAFITGESVNINGGTVMD